MAESNRLTQRKIDTAKPGDKAYKLYDGGGLFLFVHPAGGKYWRLKYRYGGREKVLAIGVYPVVTLKAARDAAFEAKRQLHDGMFSTYRCRCPAVLLYIHVFNSIL